MNYSERTVVLRPAPSFHFSPALSCRAGPVPPSGPDGGEDDQMDSHDGQRDPDSALILEGIRALYIRMDELEGRIMSVGPAYPADTGDPASHPDPAAPAAPVGPATTAGPTVLHSARRMEDRAARDPELLAYMASIK